MSGNRCKPVKRQHRTPNSAGAKCSKVVINPLEIEIAAPQPPGTDADPAGAKKKPSLSAVFPAEVRVTQQFFSWLPPFFNLAGFAGAQGVSAVTVSELEKPTPDGEQPEKEQPEKEQPEKEQPEKEQPEKEQPEKEQPEKEQPEKEQPEKEQPEKEQPEKEQPEKETA